MKVLSIALLLLASVSCAAQPPQAAIDAAHKTTHKIYSHGVFGESGSCSATAIGPHALLSAAHCLVAAPSIRVDDKEAGVVSVVGDGVDHVIYLLRGITFADYATVVPANKQPQGTHVFLFGNPGQFEDFYREGYVAGYDKQAVAAPEDVFGFLFGFGPPPPPKPATADPYALHQTYYDFNGFFGDSGSGIFNTAGQLVAVTSGVEGNNKSGVSIKFMASLDLRLTPEQLQQARAFGVTGQP